MTFARKNSRASTSAVPPFNFASSAKSRNMPLYDELNVSHRINSKHPILLPKDVVYTKNSSTSV
jgi:hypothetical protein